MASPVRCSFSREPRNPTLADRCAVKLLGRLAVSQADREISRFRTHKTAVLLARLAYYRDRPHPREELIDLLWPESDIEMGRNSLSKSLSSLRHQLEPPGAPMNSVLLADREKVQLNPAAVDTDVAGYESALRRAERAATKHEKLAYLHQALDIYAGELLPGFYED
jgi:DNA-binding SARP family transcriptional activator